MKTSQINSNQLQILRSRTNRLWLTIFLAIAFCMTPFLLPGNIVDAGYEWLLARQLPLIEFYTKSFSSGYSDWKPRLISIYLAYACSPILFLATHSFIRSLPRRDVKNRFKALLLVVPLTCFIVFSFISGPGKDMAFIRSVSNEFGIKSSIILVFELLASCGLLSMLTYALRKSNKGNI